MAMSMIQPGQRVILKGGQLYTPEAVGVGDIAVVSGTITGVGTVDGSSGAEVIDVGGFIVAPGLIDPHIHFMGASGGWGPESRSPELFLTDLTKYGFTTVVGCLGGDTVSRTIPALLIKARTLEIEGISAYVLIGGVCLPPPTLTGDITLDIAVVDRILGLKLAVSEPNVGILTSCQLSSLAAAALRGGKLGGKAGLTQAHIGRGRDGLAPVLELVRVGDFPIEKVVPTHVNRSEETLAQAIQFTQLGGTVDVTSHLTTSDSKGVPAARAVLQLLESGVDPSHISASSDAGPGTEVQNKNGPGRHRENTTPEETLRMLRQLVQEMGVDVSLALGLVTRNPARALGLARTKGRLGEGFDADVVVLTRDLDIWHVMARGRWLVYEGRPVVFGTFERDREIQRV